MHKKMVRQEELLQICRELQEQKKIVVSTSGCFDILHAGHVTYLQEAREKGDALIVLLNSDSSVKALKGEERPIVPQEERAVVLAGLNAVDYICIFSEQTPCSMIEKIRPDIVVKGGDYRGKNIPEMDIVKKYGGRVEYVSMIQGCSSTNMIEKIKKIQSI